ncbi:MAG: alpha/beta fold hydrolase [Kiritimatiellae bacterium]|nr:alpha/beta fold hydrolase [Kiritimatiellia bacterium]
MKARLFPGWAFPETTLQPIAESLHCDIRTDTGGDLWIAWSLGGLHALTQSRATTPRALILISSTARFCADSDHWPGLPTANLRALQRQLARAPEDALRGFHKLCTATASATTLETRLRDSLTLPLADGLRDLAELDLRDRLETIRQPTLLLHGSKDRVIPIAAAHALAQRLPHAQLREHPEAEHDLPIAHAGWVIEQIRDFLGADWG